MWDSKPGTPRSELCAGRRKGGRGGKGGSQVSVKVTEGCRSSASLLAWNSDEPDHKPGDCPTSWPGQRSGWLCFSVGPPGGSEGSCVWNTDDSTQRSTPAVITATGQPRMLTAVEAQACRSGG